MSNSDTQYATEIEQKIKESSEISEIEIEDKSEELDEYDKAKMKAIESEIIKETSDMLGCSESESRSVLNEINFDFKKLAALSEEFTRNYMSVKLCVESHKKDFKGYYCGIYDSRTGERMDFTFWIGSNMSKIKYLNEKTEWSAFRESIKTIKEPSDCSLYGSFSKTLEYVMNPSVINDLAFKRINVHEFIEKLEKTIEKDCKKRTIILCDYSFLNRMNILCSGTDVRISDSPVLQYEQNENSNVEEGKNVQFKGMRIYSEPVLDPVNGIPANTLKVGDAVNVVFKNTGGISTIICSNMKLNASGGILVSIREVKKTADGDFIIETRLNKFITSFFKIQGNTKLSAIVNASEPVQSRQKTNSNKTIRNDFMGTTSIAVFISALTAILIAVLFLNR